MADNLFDCFDEPTDNAAVVPLPNISKVDDDENESTVTSNTSSQKRTHDEGENINSQVTKRIKQDEDDSELTNDINVDLLNARIVIHTLETHEGCTHEVAIPPNHDYAPLMPLTSEPAKQYSFILDPFQKEAILCIDNLQSVLVSAHTSAGKTVVAEYAIALSLKNKQRVIYTTPIKALSNQKYREFSEEFHDVGLITGDVTINPSASCLIMTTEILRNMLYRGSEIMREVGWVVFDEIHYMRDKERGVVWEEILILLPDNVHYVFLSATIPNARQFAEWVCRLHSQPCHVVYTEFRPTPLHHYIFPAGGDGIHLVVDEKSIFKEDNFNTAMAVLSNAGDAAKGDQRGRRGGPRGANQSNIFNIVKMIMERNFAPVIIFSFSKKDCETYAMQMAKLDFNTIEEKKLVDEVFNNAMDVLSEEDRKLPQVENVIPLLRRGIGIHHGGLLPILKETIEILFGLGLIKALFATETFAMGLNMPARTVVFTSCQKFDGKDFRFISSGEYIQMSGRAGRRGLDDKGIVILMIDEKVTPAVVKSMIQGKADPINSAFHLTYNMTWRTLKQKVDEKQTTNQPLTALEERVLAIMVRPGNYQAGVYQSEPNVQSMASEEVVLEMDPESIFNDVMGEDEVLPSSQPTSHIRPPSPDTEQIPSTSKQMLVRNQTSQQSEQTTLQLEQTPPIASKQTTPRPEQMPPRAEEIAPRPEEISQSDVMPSTSQVPPATPSIKTRPNNTDSNRVSPNNVTSRRMQRQRLKPVLWNSADFVSYNCAESRLKFEKLREKNRHEREMRRLDLDSRRLGVDEQLTQALNRLAETTAKFIQKFG